MNDTRPRAFAEDIGKKVTELIRTELQQVPEEFRRMVTDEVINSIAITWELKKAKAGRK